MTCGVPQGSVLGPLLWDVAYDEALNVQLPPLCTTIGYADNTLVLTAAAEDYEAASKATLAVAIISEKINTMGLELAPQKTDAMVFRPRGKTGRQLSIRIDSTWIETNPNFKYLRLIIDDRWTFAEHFRYTAQKAIKVASALARLLPNVGGPSEHTRRLYSAVVHSIMMYGAPIWYPKLKGKVATPITAAQKLISIRLIRAYRTTSLEAARMLAGVPPAELMAGQQAFVFHTLREARNMDRRTTMDETTIREEAKNAMVHAWKEKVSDPFLAGQPTREAIAPVLRYWMERKHGELSYHMTQVLTGHGVFGRYLFRIGKVHTPYCEHCGDENEEDDAQHTLERCPVWEAERTALRAVIGDDLSPPALERQMLTHKDRWRAVKTFCGKVMRIKEDTERVRQNQPMRGTGGRHGH